MSQQSKRIVVFGGSGLLGSTLVPYLRKQGHRVFVAGRNSGEVQIDVAASAKVVEALRSVSADVAINLVALTNVDECDRNPDMAKCLNVDVVQTLVTACKQLDIHLIHVSTDHLYDGPGPHFESSVCLKNNYAKSKFEGEVVAASYAHATILRTNFFGHSTHMSRKSFTDSIYAGLAANKPMKLFGDVYFSPVSMTTLSKCIDVVIQNPRSGIYNLGCTEGLSKADFALTFGRALGFDMREWQVVSVDSMPGLVARPKDMRMNSDKFMNDFGFKLSSLEEEVKGEARAYERHES